MMFARKKNQGYAIVIVLVMLVIGTVVLIMFNRESLFFTKIAGIFSRTRKIQAQAMDGIELAKGDLSTLTKNSRDAGWSGDTFTSLSGSSTDAYNKGLYCDYTNNCDPATSAARTITPKISRTDGDYQLKVYYFPENPCTGSVLCSNNQKYNEALPKRFLVVSEAVNTSNGEIFTAESRIQINFENWTEIAYGVEGRQCVSVGGCGTTDPTPKYFPNSYLNVAPAVYDGRAYFDLPADKLKFIFDDNVAAQDQQHIFKDLVTFSGVSGSNGHPFLTKENPIYQQQSNGDWADSGKKTRPMMTFSKGYEENKKLTASDTDATNPASDAYFTQMQNSATYNLGTDPSVDPCPTTPNSFGIKQVDVCLKFEKNQITRYTCNKKGSAATNDEFMGRIDVNTHPAASQGVGNAYTNSSAGIFQPGTTENLFPDRYVGEHAEVYDGTVPVGKTVLGATNGVIYCNRGSDCICNIHIKGIVEGKVNVVSQRVTIEGDIRYQHQGDTSVDALGVVAKENIVIPAGLPQAATSTSSIDYSQQQYIVTQENEPPFTTTSNTPHHPGNLSEAYLNITNFIPYDTATNQYVDRNSSISEYAQYAKWTTNAGNTVPVLATPGALDLDGFFYAGNTIKVEGISNMKNNAATNETDNTGSDSFGMAFVTCEDPPTCNHYKYRNPGIKSDTDPKALYKADGTLTDSTTTGTVQPLYHIDGLNTYDMNIGQGYNFPTNANFNNTAFQPGEEVARPLNPVIHVFGGLNSKFHFIYDKMTGSTGDVLRIGFRRKMVTKNKSAAYLAPPGYPSTNNIKVDELYTKNHQGRSELLPVQ